MIVLQCNDCGRQMSYDRSIDPSIPLKVVRIVQPHCDQCWDGECEGELWFDAKGRIVPQAANPK